MNGNGNDCDDALKGNQFVFSEPEITGKTLVYEVIHIPGFPVDELLKELIGDAQRRGFNKLLRASFLVGEKLKVTLVFE